jgi:acetylornithine deacetylase
VSHQRARAEVLLEAVDAGFDDVVAFASQTVQAASVTGTEGEVAGLYERWLRDEGLHVEVKTVDAALRDRYPAMAQEVDLERRPNVLGRWSAPDPLVAPLILSGHTDVVAPGPSELWDEDPFSGSVRAGRLWGRGALDMKGPIACALLALHALRATGHELCFDVQMQCVIAEERGGLGTLSALVTEPEPSAVIVLEPTAGAICPASGGAVPFSLNAPGQAAHVCVPWTGHSAFEHAIGIHGALVALERDRNARLSHPLFDALPSKVPFAVGQVVAGEWHGTVPDQATLKGRMGVLPGESLDDVRAELVEAVATYCASHPYLADHPAQVNWDNEGFAAWETDGDAAIVQALRDGHRGAGGDGRLGAMTYGSDAGHFARAGHPTVLFGPGDIADAHLKNESVALNDLRFAASTLALALARYSDLVQELGA